MSVNLACWQRLFKLAGVKDPIQTGVDGLLSSQSHENVVHFLSSALLQERQ